MQGVQVVAGTNSSFLRMSQRPAQYWPTRDDSAVLYMISAEKNARGTSVATVK
jgi:hypothetical protein